MTKKITLDVEDALWSEFKQKIPRCITLNDSIIKLVEISLKNNNWVKWFWEGENGKI